MSDPDVPASLYAIAAATDRLLTTARRLDDAAVAGPSLLPGWNRAMVLTHLARNADGVTGMLSGARRRQVVHMYPQGREGRNADIAAGRDRPAGEVAADVAAASGALAEACALMTPEDWQAPGEAWAGQIPVWAMLVARRREVEVHHSDLGCGYGPDRWPADFVAAELDRAVADLPRRLPPGTALRLVDSDGPGQWEAEAPDAAPRNQPHVVSAPAPQLLAWLLGRPSDVTNPPLLGSWQ